MFRPKPQLNVSQVKLLLFPKKNKSKFSDEFQFNFQIFTMDLGFHLHE